VCRMAVGLQSSAQALAFQSQEITLVSSWKELGTKVFLIKSAKKRPPFALCIHFPQSGTVHGSIDVLCLHLRFIQNEFVMYIFCFLVLSHRKSGYLPGQ